VNVPEPGMFEVVYEGARGPRVPQLRVGLEVVGKDSRVYVGRFRPAKPEEGGAGGFVLSSEPLSLSPAKAEELALSLLSCVGVLKAREALRKAQGGPLTLEEASGSQEGRGASTGRVEPRKGSSRSCARKGSSGRAGKRPRAGA